MPNRTLLQVAQLLTWIAYAVLMIGSAITGSIKENWTFAGILALGLALVVWSWADYQRARSERCLVR